MKSTVTLPEVVPVRFEAPCLVSFGGEGKFILLATRVSNDAFHGVVVYREHDLGWGQPVGSQLLDMNARAFRIFDGDVTLSNN